MIRTGKFARVVYVERDHGRKRIEVQRDGKLLRYALINISPEAPIYAGERVTLKGGGLELGGRAAPLEKGSSDDKKILVFDEPGGFKLRIKGRPRTRLKLRVQKPDAVDPLSMRLYGPGAYWWQSDLHGWDKWRWIDEINGAGLNYLRTIIPARCWVAGYPKSHYLVTPTGLYDLENFDETFLREWRAALWYALLKKVVVHADMWDGHFMRYFPECWARSEYNGFNNVMGFPMPRDYESGAGSPWRKVVEHSIKQENESEISRRYGLAIIKGMQKLVSLMPKGHIVGDGNELDWRSTSRYILTHLKYPVMAYGGQPLRNEMGVDFVNHDSALMSRVKYVCVHGVDVDNVEEKYRLVLPLVRKWGVKVLFSTDGTRRPKKQSGSYRERIGRVPIPDLQKIQNLAFMISGHNCGGAVADIKLHGPGPADTVAVLEYFAKLAG